MTEYGNQISPFKKNCEKKKGRHCLFCGHARSIHVGDPDAACKSIMCKANCQKYVECLHKAHPICQCKVCNRRWKNGTPEVYLSDPILKVMNEVGEVP